MTSPDHYYLLFTCDGRLVLRGWWGTEAVARRKFRLWGGEYGSLPGARITLTDEATPLQCPLLDVTEPSTRALSSTCSKTQSGPVRCPISATSAPRSSCTP
ncbi:hypothetical protein [Streptomyces sp. NPDC003720]|uniref:hypothetical protein n=1 Tax=Streptomyces sp. NPDC003720 TaxID=3364684 RepID=UPI0036AF1BD7